MVVTVSARTPSPHPKLVKISASVTNTELNKDLIYEKRHVNNTHI